MVGLLQLDEDMSWESVPVFMLHVGGPSTYHRLTRLSTMPSSEPEIDAMACQSVDVFAPHPMVSNYIAPINGSLSFGHSIIAGTGCNDTLDRARRSICTEISHFC